MWTIASLKSLEESIQTDDLEAFIRYFANDLEPLRKHLLPSIVRDAKKIFGWIVQNLTVKEVIPWMGRRANYTGDL